LIGEGEEQIKTQPIRKTQGEDANQTEERRTKNRKKKAGSRAGGMKHQSPGTKQERKACIGTRWGMVEGILISENGTRGGEGETAAKPKKIGRGGKRDQKRTTDRREKLLKDVNWRKKRNSLEGL